jgi:hypothetical protein
MIGYNIIRFYNYYGGSIMNLKKTGKLLAILGATTALIVSIVKDRNPKENDDIKENEE